jgi:uncharacterized membrane protein AbrB (regulator of aidB expression)
MLTSEEKPTGKRTKLDLRPLIARQGIAGILAVLIIGTACAIAIIQIARGTEVSLPKYFTELSMLIVGYYFGKTSVKKE